VTGTSRPEVEPLPLCPESDEDPAGFSCSTFGDWRAMSFAVGPAQIVVAASALRARYPALKLSSDPADYAISHSNINPEAAVKPGEVARIDVAIKGWRITTQP
jgi:hypothetical protein